MLDQLKLRVKGSVELLNAQLQLVEDVLNVQFNFSVDELSM